MERKMIIIFIVTFFCALVSPLQALETGIENLEVWGYVQNEVQFATTDQPGTAPLYVDTYVSPLLGIHPAAPVINRLLKENKRSHSGSLMMFENTFNLKALYRLIPGKLEVFARFYLLFDSVYNIENDIGWDRAGMPGNPYWGPKSGDPRRRYRDDFHNQRQEDILREFYFDYHSNDWEIRIGKQMIVWGEIDGFRLLDLVNPFDLRQFILDEYEDSRIPQWGVN
ncbi:MAG: DUF1302 family protein, partial [Thermodesulfobacteriota bacterium]|nr:DUF1302 family protein [Thermodesulfobacteriota bacterium]